ncbi:MAG: exodeoxyribonuclease VII large subunit [Thermodesulfobacteriota bacterium]|nr:exodeoxyribonuclease VII large subunit [Thermodesulfobacteriota bacterium]
MSQLTQQIKLHLESNFYSVWVEGEISNLRSPSSGHRYFTLKDENSQMRTVIFRSHMRFIRFELDDGLFVICRGRVSVYEPRGDYQLIIDSIEPKGVGALQLAYEQLREKLKREGLFDDSRKRPLPLLPKKIGLVTSPSGAAVRDMIHIILRRFPNMEILVFPVRVQGEGASLEISHAIMEFNASSAVDVIITGRGGGTLEDLWAFNEEIVARAIYDSEIPVISAVGHEIDFTIADFVADLRAPTPSAAAEWVVPNKRELTHSMEQWGGRLYNFIYQYMESLGMKLDFLEKRLIDPRRKVDDLQMRLDDIMGRLSMHIATLFREKADQFKRNEEAVFFRNPKSKVDGYRNVVSQLDKEMIVYVNHYLDNQRYRFEKSLDGLERLSPLNILKRGYSITRSFPDLKIIKNSRDLKTGAKIKVKLYKGEILGEVNEIISEES